jgi:hypothetical protein
MTRYEYLEEREQLCEGMAKHYEHDENLRRFYKSAAEGFRIKRRRMSVAEAGECQRADLKR